ncbi:MAG: hypothetical protein K8R23_03535 [Chthoniobacter sp.]|nr:hypothetical protein [Chthoniobacter sp.]
MTEAPKNTPIVLDARWLQTARITKATVIVSLAILAALLMGFLHPDSAPHNQEAFGNIALKLGVPLRVFVIVVVGVAYLPLPLAFWHLFRIVFRGASEGVAISKFWIARAVFTVPRRHRDLRVSRLIVLLILGGYIVAMLTYAYIADERDLKRKGSEAQGKQARWQSPLAPLFFNVFP